MSDREDKRTREDKLDAAELNSDRISEKLSENESETEAAVHSKLSNFWYYNKWKVIVAVGLAVVLLVCVGQCCTNNSDDIVVFYSGSWYPDKTALNSINNMLTSYLPYYYSGGYKDGASLNQLGIYSDEQVEAAKKNAETDSSLSVVNVYTNQQNLQTFDNIILAGEYSICILEPWLYERVAKAGGFRLLSDVLGEKPADAYSDYALLLSETAIYKDNPGLFDGMTADTLICLRTESQIGKLFGRSGSEEEYEYAEMFFKSLVNGKNG